MFIRARRIIRLALTLLLLAFAAFAVVGLWQHYMVAPWTRDGQVRVQVADIAPQVPGQIVELLVQDNQFVHKGDLLYVIDKGDYNVSLDLAKADVASKAADQTALANLEQAQLNMQRTEVRSTVNGFVTNLLLRVGDYANKGSPNIAIVDSDSYWVAGYFEETKLGSFQVGDAAEVDLMGFKDKLAGHVESITRGISSPNATVSTQGLPSVEAVYTWVRLAQRIPVRIKIDSVPPTVTLAAGLTATVIVTPSAAPAPTALNVIRTFGNLG